MSKRLANRIYKIEDNLLPYREKKSNNSREKTKYEIFFWLAFKNVHFRRISHPLKSLSNENCTKKGKTEKSRKNAHDDKDRKNGAYKHRNDKKRKKEKKESIKLKEVGQR